MINNFKIENFKSINSLEVDFGRVNVIIGENGSGKSNVLEALALFIASALDKLDREFLSSRGIRDVEPSLMRACFSKENIDKPLILSAKIKTSEHNIELKQTLSNDNKPYSKWTKKRHINFSDSNGEKVFPPFMSKLFNLDETVDDIQRRMNEIVVELSKEDDLIKLKQLMKRMKAIGAEVEDLKVKRKEINSEVESSTPYSFSNSIDLIATSVD